MDSRLTADEELSGSIDEEACSEGNGGIAHTLCAVAESRGAAELAHLPASPLRLYTQNTLRFRRFRLILSYESFTGFLLAVLQHGQHRGWCMVRIGRMSSARCSNLYA